MRLRLPEWLVIAGFFVVATIAWTWPLVTVAGSAYVTAISDPNPMQRADMRLTTWMLAWAAHALRTNPLGLFHANSFYPLPWSFTFSEHLVAGALLVMPVDLAVGNPVLDHNLLVLLSCVLGGTGTALLLRDLGCALAAALAGGTLFAFDWFRYGALTHVQVLSSHWMPFTLLFLHRLFATGRRASALAFGACLALAVLSSVYYLYFFGLALVLFLGVHWALRCPAAPGARRLALAAAAGAALVAAWVMLPYLWARDVYALAWTSDATSVFSFPLRAFIGALVEFPLTPVGGQVVVGVGGLLLVLIGLGGGARVEGGGRRVGGLYLAVALAGVLIALGPNMRLRSFWETGVPGPWRLLSAFVPGFVALRVPARAATIALLGIAVLAGLGADVLLRRCTGRVARALVTAAVLAVALDEAWRPPLDALPVPWHGDAPPVYRWLATQPGDFAIADLPLGISELDAQAMVLSAYHWKRLVNGYSGFLPTVRYFRHLCFTFPDDASIRALAALDVRMLVLHVAGTLPHQRRLCTLPAAALPSTLTRLYQDPTACVLAITAVPPTPPSLPDAPVSLAGARVSTSSGDDARAAIDGDLGTHWVQPVTPRASGWLQLDLSGEHRISRVVLRLGPHFGEYLREYELQASSDGTTWTALAADLVTPPPLADVRRHPDDLRTEIVVPPDKIVATSHLRILRTNTTDASDLFDLWPPWSVWGVHEIELHERS